MSKVVSAALRSLYLLAPEKAHGASLRALKTGMVRPKNPEPDERLSQTIAGITFPNPLGLAAGYDKNAEVPEAVLRLGFGFTEIGTVTPKPQDGNPKPRVFRLIQDEAVINRLGFNNEGHWAALARLKACDPAAVIGVNIGANKDSEDRIADYVAGIRNFFGVARYFTANISSPNTPGLRDLQARESLSALLSAVLAARDEEVALSGRMVPVFLKIAPDLTEDELDDIAAEVLSHKLDGLIVSNTTLSRVGLTDQRQASETGGMSGKPLFEKSTIVLAKMRQRLGPDLPLIGVGGVHSADTAAEKIRAGAHLVQLYSGMVYGGPGLAAEIVRGLSTICNREKLNALSEIRGCSTEQWAARAL